eukprot:4928735-Prymnesium_polylepis.1
MDTASPAVPPPNAVAPQPPDGAPVATPASPLTLPPMAPSPSPLLTLPPRVPLPPGSSLQSRVVFVLTLDADLTTFNQSAFTNAVARVLGVAASRLSVNVEAASIHVTVSVPVSTPAEQVAVAGAAQDLAEAGPSVASSSLGFDVSSVSTPTLEEVVIPAPAATAPALPPSPLAPCDRPSAVT